MADRKFRRELHGTIKPMTIHLDETDQTILERLEIVYRLSAPARQGKVSRSLMISDALKAYHSKLEPRLKALKLA